MPARSFIRPVLFVILLIGGSLASAEPITATKEFNGDDFFFSWDFSFSIPGGLTCCPFDTINLSPDSKKHPGGNIDGLNTIGTWTPSATFTQPQDKVQLVVKAQHVRDPHTDQLGVEGGMVTFTVADILQLDVTRGAAFTAIDQAVKGHKDSVGAHSDIYKLTYRRPGVDDWIFHFEGRHVPEPGTLALIGMGLAWLGFHRARRFRR